MPHLIIKTTLILQISGGQNNIQWALPSIKHEKNNEQKSIKKILISMSIFYITYNSNRNYSAILATLQITLYALGI